MSGCEENKSWSRDNFKETIKESDLNQDYTNKNIDTARIPSDSHTWPNNKWHSEICICSITLHTEPNKYESDIKS